MTKPPSIGRFERCWWGATACWLVGTMLSWNRVAASLAANPKTAAVASGAQPAIVVAVLAITALLWWMVARQASPTGKWLVAAAAAVSALIGLGRLVGLMTAGAQALPTIPFLLGAVLTVVAAAALFRPETDGWFGLGAPESLA